MSSLLTSSLAIHWKGIEELLVSLLVSQSASPVLGEVDPRPIEFCSLPIFL